MRMQIILLGSKNQLLKNRMRKCLAEQRGLKAVVLSLDPSWGHLESFTKYSCLVPPTGVLLSLADAG